MDWLTEIAKVSPGIAGVIGLVWLIIITLKQKSKDTEQILQQYLDRFNEQQQKIEAEFREYLIKDSQENRRVIEEYTKVIKAFNETVSKTNIILEQNIDINRRLLIQTEKHNNYGK